MHLMGGKAPRAKGLGFMLQTQSLAQNLLPFQPKTDLQMLAISHQELNPSPIQTRDSK